MRGSVLVMLLITLGAACGDDGGGADADARVDARVAADAEPADADTRPDAFVPCPGEAYFAGEYIDWDSTPATFKGVPLADMVERGNTSNTDQTSPNGRWEICVALATDADFDVTQSDYLDVIIAMDADGHAMAPLTVRGLTPARRDVVFSAAETDVTFEPTDAQVQVDLRRPNGDPVVGATVAIGAANDGGFTFDASHVMTSGTTTTDDGTVLFANVAAAGTTTVTVTPPSGLSCVGRGQIPVAAGVMTATSFACN